MSFTDTILDRVSHIYDDDLDEILVFVLLFIFIFLAGPGDDLKGGFGSMSTIPVILIAVFLVLFLITGNVRAPAE